MNTDPSPSTLPLLDVRDLSVVFHTEADSQHAVRDLSFDLFPRETIAIVGESGSGKSVTALALTGLLPAPPVCTVTGRVSLEGRNLLALDERALCQVRGRRIAYIFQEPGTSLNPVLTVGNQIAEAIRLHRPDVEDPVAEIIRVLDRVGIKNPEHRHRAYPHELSGGMQQRVMIAMALACRPQILVADEPTTALDVTIQKQIMDLLLELKSSQDMSVLLISHNFGIVSGFADRVLVMFRGRLVEQGPTTDVLRQPRHPYTRALIECIPRLGHRTERLTTIDYSTFDAEA